MKKNLILYRIYFLLNDPGVTWPVYFLLMLKFISLQDILLIQALQQIAVVALEVPSGLFSDRFGRKPTLIVSAVAGLCCFLSLIVADSFLWFLISNALWAVNSSFVSGTDSSFHFDSLEALGRQGEFPQRDGRLRSWNLVLQASLAIVGGWLFSQNPRLPFIAAGIIGSIALLATFWFQEPPKFHAAVESALLRQLKDVSNYFQRPIFRWILGFAALSTVLDYLPYQYYQPYIDLVREQWKLSSATSIITGWHASATMAVGAAALALAPKLLRKFKPTTVLLAGSWIHFSMVIAMSLLIDIRIAVCLIFREIPNGLKAIAVPSLILPSVSQSHRATVLSLINFVAKLVVSGAFLLLSNVKGDGVFAQMSLQLRLTGGACLLVWLYLLWRRPKVDSTTAK